MFAPLTRKALYDLVWSKPRTTLAKEMGVSDVWIGKQCRALNVPAPPPGYWANLAAGGKPKAKYLRPPLTYTVAERMLEDHDNAALGLDSVDAKDFEQAVPSAPAFPETIEEAVDRYVRLARALAARRRAAERHPVVQRLLTEDERRASKASPYSWEEPLYRGAQGQAILQAMDRIAWHWTGCGLRVTASGGHTVSLAVSGAGQTSSFELRAAPAPKGEARPGRPPSRTGLEFWLDPDCDSRRQLGKPALAFSTLDIAAIDALTAAVFTMWERRLREWLHWRYNDLVATRERTARAVQEALQREQEQREAEVRALYLRRQRLLLRAIDRARRAQEIRGLVAAMQASPSAQGINAGASAQWSAWALGQADAMDMRVQPPQVVEKWLGEFELGTGGAS